MSPSWNPHVGWLAGGAPGTRLWATRDGGDTWTLQPLAAPAGYQEDEGSYWGGPTFFDASNGVVARTFANNQSEILAIYRSSDGGRTWQPVRGPLPAAASSWSFPARSDWILWDPYHTKAWQSADQGGTWTAFDPVGLPSDAAPVMTDALHGWALSTHALTIHVTSDRGRTWTSVDPRGAPAAPTGAVESPPSPPPMNLSLSGPFGVTITGTGDQGMCRIASPGVALISPEPIAVAQNQFIRVTLWAPTAPGTYQADALIGRDGTASVQATVLANPAGGGGDPPWQAVSGSVTVSQAGDFWNPGRFGVTVGTIDAVLSRPGQPDLRISGQMGLHCL